MSVGVIYGVVSLLLCSLQVDPYRIVNQKTVDSDVILRDSIRPVCSQSLILSGKDVSRVGLSSATDLNDQHDHQRAFTSMRGPRCWDNSGSAAM